MENMMMDIGRPPGSFQELAVFFEYKSFNKFELINDLYFSAKRAFTTRRWRPPFMLEIQESINFYYTLLIFLRNEPRSAAKGRR